MPIYGKGRVERKSNDRHPIKTAHIREQIEDGPRKRRRTRWVLYEWTVFHTPLSRISADLNFDIPSWVKRKLEHKPHVNVLDWGCGSGVAATQLSEQLGSKVNVYGYGDMPHPTWARNSRVKFIWQDHETMLRYFKDRSLDLIYSRLGLYQMLKDTIPLGERVSYFARLSRKLYKNGVLVTNTGGFRVPPAFLTQLQQEVPDIHAQFKGGILLIARTRRP